MGWWPPALKQSCVTHLGGGKRKVCTGLGTVTGCREQELLGSGAGGGRCAIPWGFRVQVGAQESPPRVIGGCADAIFVSLS